MKIEISPVEENRFLKSKNNDSITINFKIFLDGENVNIKAIVNSNGIFMKMPFVERLKINNCSIHIKLGKAINSIISLEGEEMKNIVIALLKNDNIVLDI